MTQWPACDAASDAESNATIDSSLSILRQLLTEDPKFDIIRLHIDSTPGTGHQSSSLHLLRRLVAPLDNAYKGFGYNRIVEVYYTGDDNDRLKNLLLEALPELQGQTEGTLYEGTARIKLLDYRIDPPRNPVFLGFTGGLDNSKDILKTIKVESFLCLQPFGWDAPDELLIEETQPIDLRKTLFLGGASFKERAYFHPEPALSPIEWSYYTENANTKLAKKARIIQWLTLDVQLQRVSLCSAYSIRDPDGTQKDGICPMGTPARDRIVQIMTGFSMMLKASRNPKPVLILNFDDYAPRENSSFICILDLLKGGPLAPEKVILDAMALLKAKEKRERLNPTEKSQLTECITKSRTYFARQQAFQEANDATTFLFEEDPDLDTIKIIVEKLSQTPRAVVFIQLGRVPPPLYAYFMNKAQMPAIFEGQNNAGLALTLGKAYLSVSHPGDAAGDLRSGIIRYPGTIRGQQVALAAPINCETAARSIREDLKDGEQTEEIGEFLTTGIHEDGIPAYFQSLKTYYREVRNDKFALALIYYAHRLRLKQEYLAVSPLADNNPLDALFEELQSQIVQFGEVNLVPGVFSQGTFADFYRRLLPVGGSLLIQEPVLEREPPDPGTDLQAVLINGTAQIASSTSSVAFRFTAPYGSLLSATEFTDTHSWTPDGLSWIVFTKPFIRMNVADEILPVTGSVGGTVSGTDLEIAMDLPLTDGQTAFRGTFAELKTIDAFLALAGGVDITAELPTPLKALTGLGVRYVEFAYNHATSSMEYISFRLESDQAWPFLWFNLERITIEIAITQPGDPARRKTTALVAGQFALGSGAEPPTIVIGAALPGWRITGQLGDVPLTIDDLLKLFHLDITPQWPGGQPPQIAVFTFAYGIQSGDYEVYTSINLDWPIEIAGQEILRIVSIALSLIGDSATSLAGLSGFLTVLPDSANIGLSLTALYMGQQQGWRFEGRQTSGTISLSALFTAYLHWNSPFQLDIDGLELIIETATNSFEFAGQVKGAWQPPIQDGITFSGTLRARIGYNGGSETLGPDLVRVGKAEMPVLFADDGSPLWLLPAASHRKQPGWFGEVSLDLVWNGIELTLFYNFDPTYQAFGITWGIFTGRIEEKVIGGQKHQIVTLQFTETTTLGSMVETMVSWLTGSKFALAAPWSVLNSISLNRLALVYDFTAGTVSFDVAVGPLELGIARIETISLNYRTDPARPAESGVIITLKGSFLWQSDPQQPLSWDAARPETTQGPPGSGNKYLDLRLLALGQHVLVNGLPQSPSVQKAIDLMRTLPLPQPGELPGVTLDAGSSWFIGAEFGVLRLEEDEDGYLLTMQIVFNDPRLYGLRLKLAGRAAKILTGLDFQILYRQVSETVGVYQAEITLPNEMRRFSIGAYTLTLPVFGVAVYTNGDFQLDLGFPWNADFSRSFSIEALVAPGIPLLGSAGLYFGKLSNATSLMPETTKGLFEPVLVFGFGAQMGFGKSLEYSVLKAGFSLTIVGLLEGVLAKWNPYAPARSAAPWLQMSDAQMEGEFYYWLRGTLGISGKLYGSVDFSIIKADVTVQIVLLVQITLEAYQPLALTVQAAVDVAVTLQINLGFVKITISLTFSLQIKETFTILNSGTAPWSLAAPPRPGLLSAPRLNRLRAWREMQALPVSKQAVPNWSNLAPAVSKVELKGYLVPTFTVAGDRANRPDEQEACAVALLFIQSPPPVTRDTESSALKARGELDDTSFEILCKQVLRWVIAAMQDRRLSADDVDRLVVSDQQLLSWFTQLSSPDFSLPVEVIDPFLASQYHMRVHESSSVDIDATFFPLAPGLVLNIPDYGTWRGYTYSFEQYNVVSTDFLARLREYFDRLAVQVQNESGATTSRPASNEPLSVASFIFSDYFLLLCRQMLQAARSALRDFTSVLSPGTTTGAIVNWVNTTGNLGGAFTLSDLFAANPTHPLVPQRTLVMEATYQITAATESFVSISSALGSTFTPTDLARSNAAHPTLLRPGAQIHYPGQPAYPIQAGDDLLSVANHYHVTLADLLSQAGLLEQADLLQPSAALFVPSITYQALAVDSLTAIAHMEIYGGAFTSARLAQQNAGRAILRPGKAVTYPGKLPYFIQSGDCLGDLANIFDVSFTALLEQTDLLQRPDVLAPAAILILPPFAASTRPGETLQSLARRLNTSIALLAASPDNLQIQDLFDGSARRVLDLPHLPQFRVKELLEEIQRSLSLQQLSGMTSRYYLHGLRLPTAGITPRYRGMWVQQGNNGALTLPAEAGLYALTGQQFPLPTIETQDFIFYLIRSANLAWLFFDGLNSSRLTLTIKPGSNENRALQALRGYTRGNRLPVELAVLGEQAQLTRTPATYSLTSALSWQASATVALPYGSPPDGVPVLRLWQLPAALTDLPDPHTRALNPRFKMQVARYDEASGATVNDDLSSYGWASTIAFTVKKVAVPASTSTSAAIRTTCEIVGASGSALVLLERLVSAMGQGEDPLDILLLGYASEQAGSANPGIQTDAPDQVTMGIARVNLSTETRPTRALVSTAAAGPTLFNSRAEFVRLLWEASITRTGGFYLYYYNAEDSSGLPERIFNDKGEAVLTLIALYRRPQKVADQNTLSLAMNALATAEPLETAQSVIFAEADPLRPAPSILAQEDDTLANLAFRYYGDVAELAQDNAEVSLRQSAVLTISQGLYEVPPSGVEPGGNLERIAAHFGTTSQAIKDANPRITNWPDPLPLFLAIRLPRLQITVGPGPDRKTLGALARFYGESLSVLAADNKQTPDLFTGQMLVIAGGPVVSRPAVPTGVLAQETQRPVPLPIPADPGHPDYARLSLLHLYTLLSFQVSENADFFASTLSLPAGPTTEGTAGTHSKIRIPREPAPGDLWTYRQALPYPQLVRQVFHAIDGLPDPAKSPYRALGRLLQLDMAWQDLYGNRLITTLSRPALGDSGPLNHRPYLTGYSDLLLGLNQWPAISAGWQVLPARLPRLEVLLSFDDSQYQGLLQIAASTATTLLASFTLPLDPGSATELANYRLNSGPIQRARLLDNTTVELTISALPVSTTCTLTIENLKVSGQDRVLSGQASCHYPDDPAQRTSTLQEQARRDLAVYTTLYYQLSDPNGIDLAFNTSLLTGSRLPVENPGALLGWLGTIYTFLADRARAGKQAPLPQQEYHLGADIPAGYLNEQQIFALTLAVQIIRTGGLVSGDLATVAGLREVSTEVAPLVQHLEDASDTLSLTVFASRFEEAFTVAGAYQLKVATGVDRFRRSPARSGSTLWAVRLSLAPTDTTGLSFSLANPGKPPAIFAPQPVSNRLISQYHVPIYDYVTDEGINFAIPSRFIDFIAIDLDLWIRQVFAELDGLLTPEFTAAIQVLDLRQQMACLTRLLAAKRELASLASEWMIPVFTDELASPRTIQQIFEQQMLQQLSNAYTTRAGLQFQVRVQANIQPPPGQLLGTIIQQTENNKSARQDVAMTSPKLLLQTGTSNPLTFLLTAPDVVLDDQGHVLPNLPLKLSYEGSQIEHQIGKLPGIEDYLASSWLSFIRPVTDGPLSAPLGEFPVPLVLRNYPPAPTMLEQAGTFPRQPGDPLTQLTRWNYSFTYSLPFHYPQDTLFGMVYFSVSDTLTGKFPAAFGDLAEFITVFPAVQRDLREALAAINAGTTDEGMLKTATFALISFRDMIERIAKSARLNGGLVHPPVPTAPSTPTSYAFHIEEGCIQREGVAALLITLHGQPPAGLTAPQVLIDPEIYEVQPFSCAGEDCSGEAIQGDFCFWYRHRATGLPLSAVEGQRIQERQILFTGLDLFAAQDAIAWSLLQRNENLVLGRTTAKPFVYTTGRVTFANPFHPTSDSGEQVINLATIGSGNPPHPITRSFVQHLEALFIALLQATTQPSLVVQAEIHHEYAIHPDLSAVPLAILLQPPHTINVANGGSNSLAEMIATWEEAIKAWGKAYDPQKTSGNLWFDLTIMSDLTSQPLPLLRLRLLCLPLSTINPPLW